MSVVFVLTSQNEHMLTSKFEKTHIILNLLSHFEFEIRDTNQEPLNEIMREKRDSYFSVLRNTNLKFGKTDVNLISLMSDHVSLF